ncbi:MAG: hypothetical protein ACREQ5_05465 [Candidatus Dormibacteria bacterium]
MATATAGVVTGAAAVTGGADPGTLGTTGRARGATVVGGAVICPLPDRSGKPPTRKYRTADAATTTTTSAEIPMICLDPDRLTGAWITSGPRPSHALCWSAPGASATVAKPESDTS